MRTQDHGFKFAGNVQVRNRREAGSGFYDIGNTTALKTTQSADTKERVSRRKETHGQALDILKTPKPVEISLELDTFDKDNLAAAMMGASAVIAAAALTVADEVIVIGKRGQGYKLAHGNIDASTVSVKKADDDSAVDAAQYGITAAPGLIALAADSTLPDGTELKVSYKTRAGGGYKIDAAAVSELEWEIIVDGENTVTGEKGILRIPCAKLAADGDFDWFKDDFNTASFKGTAVLADGNTAPYSFEVYK
ncbi:Uncharacterised protein [Kingella potus]|uniref:Uncharacterized protein n=1 Tax=Kingella potus TaxID=265175 RepID=A0A377QYA5_9NEIS|nr:hypothetical protein [Kingella potus]UOP00533.1 hypothetical protein LVJ84_11930 [Kingella potus]UOP02017.1 hypothetical protein LVJ84_14280 [Kingella potus]STQ99849.1 Uncharacterised protein [Kingella potus]